MSDLDYLVYLFYLFPILYLDSILSIYFTYFIFQKYFFFFFLFKNTTSVSPISEPKRIRYKPGMNQILIDNQDNQMGINLLSVITLQHNNYHGSFYFRELGRGGPPAYLRKRALALHLSMLPEHEQTIEPIVFRSFTVNDCVCLPWFLSSLIY